MIKTNYKKDEWNYCYINKYNKSIKKNRRMCPLSRFGVLPSGSSPLSSFY
jgi:hypothetical protein